MTTEQTEQIEKEKMELFIKHLKKSLFFIKCYLATLMIMSTISLFNINEKYIESTIINMSVYFLDGLLVYVMFWYTVHMIEVVRKL